jgi:hypothetical protein
VLDENLFKCLVARRSRGKRLTAAANQILLPFVCIKSWSGLKQSFLFRCMQRRKIENLERRKKTISNAIKFSCATLNQIEHFSSLVGNVEMEKREKPVGRLFLIRV